MKSMSGSMAGVALTALLFAGCSQDAESEVASPTPRQDPKQPAQKALDDEVRIIFLHHSTGQCIWDGGVGEWLDAYNDTHDTQYKIEQVEFPKSEPYGWSNFPYDYWNIWVRHAGPEPYKTEPTLEILTTDYDVIVFKHCFPVSNIEPDTGRGDVASEEKRIENYKLQYAALKEKLHSFPETRFILWTGAAQPASDTDEAQGRRAKSFFDWVKTTWDEPGDNIYVWDFYSLEIDGGLYLKPAYSSGDGHPNEVFSTRAAPLLAQRIVDVIRGAGDNANIAGAGGDSTPLATSQTESSGGARESRPGPPPEQVERNAPALQPALSSASNSFVFDDAEDPRRADRWPKSAAYADDAGGRVIQIRFAEGKQEDWGEYGRQRIVATNPPQQDWDISPYGYAAFRIRADRDMSVNFTLVAEGDRTDDSYFGFTAYPEAQADQWKWVVLDLAKLELGAEGETAYAAAGQPTRPMTLTRIRLVTHEKNARAAFAIDDIAFYRTRPEFHDPP